MLNRALEVATGDTDPEPTRASAVGAIENLVPALTAEEAATALAELEPLALGRAALSKWNLNITHPLSALVMSLHEPGVLRAAAIGAHAQLIAAFPDLGRQRLSEVVRSALRDGPEIVLVAAFEAVAKVPAVEPPIELEAAMVHVNQQIRQQALAAYAARHERLPPDESLQRLLQDPSPVLREDLLQIASMLSDGERALEPLTHDADAYIRALALQRLKGRNPS